MVECYLACSGIISIYIVPICTFELCGSALHCEEMTTKRSMEGAEPIATLAAVKGAAATEPSHRSAAPWERSAQ